MIYITIPEGWVFKPAGSTKSMLPPIPAPEESRSLSIPESAGTGECPPLTADDVIEQDSLLNKETGVYLPLQGIIKDALRNNTKRQLSMTIKDKDTNDLPITIYFKKPRYSDKDLLEYQPNRNGKIPSEKPTKIIEKYGVVPSHSKGYTGTLFHRQQDTLLTPERRAALEEKAIEQRDNRRHIGDSPKAT